MAFEKGVLNQLTVIDQYTRHGGVAEFCVQNLNHWLFKLQYLKKKTKAYFQVFRYLEYLGALLV